MILARLVLIGAGGHAAVLVDILRDRPDRPVVAIDPNGAGEAMTDYPEIGVVGSDADAGLPVDRSIVLVNGVGFAPPGLRRAIVHERYTGLGHAFASVVSQHAIVSADAALGQGVQLLQGSCIQRGARIGDGAIVNTRAVVEHDCIVGPQAHIAPGAVLCGQVVVGAKAFVGAGAVVIPGVTIGDGALVGAGVTVRHDVEPATRFVG